MKMPILTEARMAHAGAWLSRESVAHPLLGRVVIGPHITRVAYRVSQTSADEVPASSWAVFDGDPEGARLPFPRLYKQAGVVQVKDAVMDALRDRLDSPKIAVRPAVAFRFGELLLAASIDEEKHPETFGMGQGRGQNFVTAGFIAQDGRLYVPDNAVAASAEGLRQIPDLVAEGITVY